MFPVASRQLRRGVCPIAYVSFALGWAVLWGGKRPMLVQLFVTCCLKWRPTGTGCPFYRCIAMLGVLQGRRIPVPWGSSAGRRGVCCLSSPLPPNSVRYPQATVLLTQTLCSTPYPLHLGLVDRFLKLVTKSGLLRLQLFSGPQYPGTRVRGQLLP